MPAFGIYFSRYWAAVLVALIAMAPCSAWASKVTELETVSVRYVNNGGGGATSLGPVTVTAPRGGYSGGRIVNFETIPVTAPRENAGGGVPTLGTVHAIRPNPGDPGQPTHASDPEIKCGQMAGNPIVFSTGNKVEFETDFTSAGEMGLFLSRTYNHYWSGIGLFGQHWLSNFDYSLTSSGVGGGATNLWLQRPDGRRIKFNRTAAGRWEEDKAQAIAYVTLLGATYTHYSEDGLVETYSSSGYVTRLANRQGVAWDFTYSNNYLQRVTHSSGRYVQFTWAGGQLTRVTDPAGNAYSFSYTANALGAGRHRLASATSPGAPVTTVQYHYEDSRFPGGLTGKSYNNVRYSRFTYDAGGRATSSEHAGGVDRYSFTYELNPAPPPPTPRPPPPPPVGGVCDPRTGVCTVPRGGAGPLMPMSLATHEAVASIATPGTIRRVVQTNPLGKKTTYEFEGGKLIATIGHASANCPAADKLIVYDSNGYPSITEDFGGTITYTTYNAKGQLLETREAPGTSVERKVNFGWLANNLIGRETIAGQRETVFAYDSLQRVASVSVKNLSANGVASQTRTTNYSYSAHVNKLLATVTVDGPLPGAGDSVKYTYASNGALSRIDNGIGHATIFQSHNALGAPGKVVGANGDVVEYVYDARGRIVRERKFPNGNAADTMYAYDAAGMPSRITLPDGHYREFSYTADRRLAEIRMPQGGNDFAATRYTYDAMGNAIRTEISRDTWVPINGAQFVSQSVPNPMVRGQSYSVTVRLKNTGDTTWSSAQDYKLGIRNQVGESAWGVSRVPVSGSVAPGATATFGFNVTAPSTSGSYNFQWRMQQGASGFGSTTPNVSVAVSSPTQPPPPPGGGWCDPVRGICYDPMSTPDGELSEPALPLGMQSAVVYREYVDYDELGRVIRERGNNGQSLRYTYDATGNIVTVTNALGHRTTYSYDQLHRVVRVVAPLGSTSRYEYDTLNRLTKVTDPKGKVTSYIYDGFGQLWAQSSPDTGITRFEHDAYGRLTRLTRADNTATTYAYDAVGRVIRQQAGGQTQAFVYDSCSNGKGRLCGFSDASGSTAYAYTAYGQLQSAAPVIGTSSVDFSTDYLYDQLGRIAQIRYPNGQLLKYTYANGQLSRISAVINGSTQVMAKEFKYSPTGAESEWKHHTGVTRRLSHDMDGRVTSISLDGAANVQALTYSYDAADQITRVGNGVHSSVSQTYAYDALGRLTEAASSARNQSFAYDLNSNRVEHVFGNGTTTFGYAGGGNRLTQVNRGTSTTPVIYTANGNTSSVGSTAYAYDPFNRLKSAVANGVTTNYWTNAIGQRVYKTQGVPRAAFFIYGPSGELLAEYGGFNGSMRWRNYFWKAGELFALTDGAAKRMVHVDHLGRPEVATDIFNSVVWRSNNYAYDRTIRADSIGGLNVGFPGQYYDEETGIWYNYYRNYDSNTGRYLESDPSGLQGGLNTYIYANANPVEFIDSNGLRGVRRAPPRNPWNAYQAEMASRGVPKANVLINYRQLKLSQAGVQRDLQVAGENAPDAWNGGVKEIDPVGCVVAFCGPGVDPNAPANCPVHGSRTIVSAPGQLPYGCRCL